MRDKLYVVLIAISLATASFFFTGAVFLLIVFGSVCYLILKNAPLEDRRFILSVLIAGFLIRLGVAMSLHAFSYLKGYEGATSGDDLLYTVRSWAIVFKWEGKPYSWVQDLSGSLEYGVNPFTFIMALFYKVFGFHPMSVKIINCIIGTLIGWMSYLIGKELFGRKAGRIAMLISMFYPSLIRWSIANLKDSLTILSFMVCVYICVALIYNRMAIWKYGVLVLSIVTLYFFVQRFHFVLALGGVAAAVALRAFTVLNMKSRMAILSMTVIIFLAGGVYFFSVNTKPLIKLIQACEEKQFTIAKSDYAGYHFYSDDFMRSIKNGKMPPPEFLKSVFLSTSYFMLTPFPWQMTSRERAVAYPQMLLWYLVLFLAVFGYFKLACDKTRAAILIGIMLFAGVIVHAMAEGNIGAAFRHRDLFTPFFLVLASPVIAVIINTSGKDA
ncbi:MAG: glycosyltransferase family 39 protein [Candidatus Omnitrophica bacterium]|nr:glycosyltransferase family 39 protein [Candidatus Omnitrophota bacterium]